ncbi:hypothetical protein [Nocardioides sp. SYSU DS0651]|uniref:hypothetical protein n=1 Tax=Nocardioides sp. SYSU DS0651 TaxID=3415955 RepID=UPI003F4B57D0
MPTLFVMEDEREKPQRSERSQKAMDAYLAANPEKKSRQTTPHPNASRNERAPSGGSLVSGSETPSSRTSDSAQSGFKAPRTAAAIVLVFIALGLFFGMGPSDYDRMREQIEDRDDRNNSETSGAPQQQVVNGWTTNEYLELLSVQAEESNARRDALLLLGLIGAGTVLFLPAQRSH